MSKKHKKIRKTGLPPGSLIYTGQLHDNQADLELISFNPNDYFRKKVSADFLGELSKDSVNWLKVTGINEVDAIESIGKSLKLNPLLLEDVLNTDLRPVFAEYPDAIFVSIKALQPADDKHEFRQLSFVLTPQLIISFSEEDHTVFKILEERMLHDRGRIRDQKLDYLLYAFIDVTVDQYIEYLDEVIDNVEMYEEKILDSPSEIMLYEIQQIRKHLVHIEKMVFPLREILGQLVIMDDRIVKNYSQHYFRDINDHVLLLLENIRSTIESTSNLKDFYASRVTLNMNKVVQLLTLVSVTFIPLTFIAGVYGMNFDNMPELRWRYGYFAVLGLMLVVFTGFLLFYKRKKWL